MTQQRARVFACLELLVFVGWTDFGRTTKTQNRKNSEYVSCVIAMLMKFLLLIACLAVASGFTRGPLGINYRSQRFMSEVSEGVEKGEEMHQVFVGNMPFEIEDGELNDMVKERLGDKAGTFKGVKIPKDRNTGRSRGFGYIDFGEKEDAVAAVEMLAGMTASGRDFKIDLSVPRGERPERPERPKRERKDSENSVFIGNLDFSVTQDEVQAMCADILGNDSAGKVRIAVDRDTQRPRGFGHIDFESKEEAERAVEQLHGIQLVSLEIEEGVIEGAITLY